MPCTLSSKVNTMDDRDRTDIEEEQIARLLRAAGPREQLPEALKQRWEGHFRDELASVSKARTQKRRRLAAGLAAGLAAIAITLSLVMSPRVSHLPAVQVVTVSGTVTRSLDGEGDKQLQAGQRLAVGDRLKTGGDSFTAIKWGGYDLRLNRDTRLNFREDGVSLDRGQIYVSDDPNRIGRFQLVVTTPQGSIRDIGTQFTVSVEAQRTVTTVRRGTVELDTGTATHRAKAESGSASRVSVDRDLQVHTDRVPPSGRDWAWIYLADPGFALEGSSAWEFLQWSVGESGMQLVFESAAAEAYARITTLHGSIEGLDPERAVAPVLAATDLNSRVGEGILYISLER